MEEESKELVDDVNEEFGRKLSEKFMDNRKLFWKEVKESHGTVEGGSGMKWKDGVLGSSKEEVKGVWKRHFECLMNGGTGGKQ